MLVVVTQWSYFELMLVASPIFAHRIQQRPTHTSLRHIYGPPTAGYPDKQGQSYTCAHRLCRSSACTKLVAMHLHPTAAGSPDKQGQTQSYTSALEATVVWTLRKCFAQLLEAIGASRINAIQPAVRVILYKRMHRMVLLRMQLVRDAVVQSTPRGVNALRPSL